MLFALVIVTSVGIATIPGIKGMQACQQAQADVTKQIQQYWQMAGAQPGPGAGAGKAPPFSVSCIKMEGQDNR